MSDNILYGIPRSLYTGVARCYTRTWGRWMVVPVIGGASGRRFAC